jgi:hypothetical protein
MQNLSHKFGNHHCACMRARLVYGHVKPWGNLTTRMIKLAYSWRNECHDISAYDKDATIIMIDIINLGINLGTNSSSPVQN